ncbi:glycosyltransferase family 2 protein [Rhizosphaericola mali]|uniref:Glycosyltransferase family 2 protein n=1 Tax=Rhizosphaericola mali TaxID=2545455 RepID=A0A5P2G1Z8_9BACT|nr:glycosyltransferase family 2 protein [Rhizosphaericola mali]QES89197.1 glycosyltransferase family 2 protein [Rhizosphaericola mali]
MNKDFKISIIVPVYNVEAYIERSINSIINQSCKEFELLIINDCSTDNTISLINGLLEAKFHINYRIVNHTSNCGVSKARNTGIENAKGEYIFFVDSDDELEIDAIKQITESMTNLPQLEIYLFNARFKNSNENDLKMWRPPGSLPNILSPNKALEFLFSGKIGGYLWQFLFKRALFENVKFTDGSVWEDAVILPELILKSSQVASFDNIFIYKYFLRDGSISQSVHPQIDEVVPSLNKLEKRIYSNQNSKQNNLYGYFISYRTGLTMQLSRECFVRTRDFRKLMKIHKKWGRAIPYSNIRFLFSRRKLKSAMYLEMIKHAPSLLFLLYKTNILN